MSRRFSIGPLVYFIIAITLTLTGCLEPPSLSANLGTTPPSRGELVSHLGYSTAALLFIDNDEEVESKVKVLCTAVWVDQTHLLTADHCIKKLQEDLQAEQDKKEKAAKEEPTCSIAQQIFGACEDEDKPKDIPHKIIKEEEVPLHYAVWQEVMDVGLEPSGWHLASVERSDATHDLALLLAVGHAIPPHQIAKLAPRAPELLEKVYAVGHIKGLYWTFLEGVVAGQRGQVPAANSLGPFLQLSVPIYHGSSGGGAFNERGELIGICDFIWKAPAEGFFVGWESLKKFLSSAK